MQLPLKVRGVLSLGPRSVAGTEGEYFLGFGRGMVCGAIFFGRARPVYAVPTLQSFSEFFPVPPKIAFPAAKKLQHSAPSRGGTSFVQDADPTQCWRFSRKEGWNHD